MLLPATRRAVAIRKQCSEYYRSEAGDIDDNDGHAFMIKILEDVIALLEPFESAESASSQKFQKKMEEEANSLCEHISSLSIEEDEQCDQSVVQESLDLATNGTASINQVPEPTRKSNIAFAAILLLGDLNQILDYIRTLWEAYAKGRLDYVTTSLVSNLAIDMVRRMEEDFVGEFDVHQKFGSIGGLMEHLSRDHHWKVPKPSAFLDTASEIDVAKIEPARRTFMDLYGLLEYLVVSKKDELDAFWLPDLKAYRQSQESYDPKSARSKMSIIEMYMEDKYLVLEIVPHIVYSIRDLIVPLFDNLTEAVGSTRKFGKIHFWTCFAIRVLLESHHALRENVDRPFQGLQELARQIQKSTKGHEEQRWSSQHEKYLREMVLSPVNKWILEDTARTQNQRKVQKSIPGSDFEMVRNCPL